MFRISRSLFALDGTMAAFPAGRLGVTARQSFKIPVMYANALSNAEDNLLLQTKYVFVSLPSQAWSGWQEIDSWSDTPPSLDGSTPLSEILMFAIVDLCDSEDDTVDAINREFLTETADSEPEQYRAVPETLKGLRLVGSDLKRCWQTINGGLELDTDIKATDFINFASVQNMLRALSMDLPAVFKGTTPLIRYNPETGLDLDMRLFTRFMANTFPAVPPGSFNLARLAFPNIYPENYLSQINSIRRQNGFPEAQPTHTSAADEQRHWIRKIRDPCDPQCDPACIHVQEKSFTFNPDTLVVDALRETCTAQLAQQIERNKHARFHDHQIGGPRVVPLEVEEEVEQEINNKIRKDTADMVGRLGRRALSHFRWNKHARFHDHQNGGPRVVPLEVAEEVEQEINNKIRKDTADMVGRLGRRALSHFRWSLAPGFKSVFANIQNFLDFADGKLDKSVLEYCFDPVEDMASDLVPGIDTFLLRYCAGMSAVGQLANGHITSFIIYLSALSSSAFMLEGSMSGVAKKQWRIHIMLTGSAGMGKSKIMDVACRAIPRECQMYTGSMTAAGGLALEPGQLCGVLQVTNEIPDAATEAGKNKRRDEHNFLKTALTEPIATRVQGRVEKTKTSASEQSAVKSVAVKQRTGFASVMTCNDQAAEEIRSRYLSVVFPATCTRGHRQHNKDGHRQHSKDMRVLPTNAPAHGQHYKHMARRVMTCMAAESGSSSFGEVDEPPFFEMLQQVFSTASVMLYFIAIGLLPDFDETEQVSVIESIETKLPGSLKARDHERIMNVAKLLALLDAVYVSFFCTKEGIPLGGDTLGQRLLSVAQQLVVAERHIISAVCITETFSMYPVEQAVRKELAMVARSSGRLDSGIYTIASSDLAQLLLSSSALAMYNKAIVQNALHALAERRTSTGGALLRMDKRAAYVHEEMTAGQMTRDDAAVLCFVDAIEKRLGKRLHPVMQEFSDDDNDFTRLPRTTGGQHIYIPSSDEFLVVLRGGKSMGGGYNQCRSFSDFHDAFLGNSRSTLVQGVNKDGTKKKRLTSAERMAAGRHISAMAQDVGLNLFSAGEVPSETVTKRVVQHWKSSTAADKPFYTAQEMPGNLQVVLFNEGKHGQVQLVTAQASELVSGIFVSVAWIARALAETSQEKGADDKHYHVHEMLEAVVHQHTLPRPVLLLMPHSQELPFPCVVHLRESQKQLVLTNPRRQNPAIADIMRAKSTSASRAPDRIVDGHPATQAMLLRMERHYGCKHSPKVLPKSLVGLVHGLGAKKKRYPDELLHTLIEEDTGFEKKRCPDELVQVPMERGRGLAKRGYPDELLHTLIEEDTGFEKKRCPDELVQVSMEEDAGFHKKEHTNKPVTTHMEEDAGFHKKEYTSKPITTSMEDREDASEEPTAKGASGSDDHKLLRAPRKRKHTSAMEEEAHENSAGPECAVSCSAPKRQRCREITGEERKEAKMRSSWRESAEMVWM